MFRHESDKTKQKQEQRLGNNKNPQQNGSD